MPSFWHPGILSKLGRHSASCTGRRIRRNPGPIKSPWELLTRAQRASPLAQGQLLLVDAWFPLGCASWTVVYGWSNRSDLLTDPRRDLPMGTLFITPQLFLSTSYAACAASLSRESRPWLFHSENYPVDGRFGVKTWFLNFDDSDCGWLVRIWTCRLVKEQK